MIFFHFFNFLTKINVAFVCFRSRKKNAESVNFAPCPSDRFTRRNGNYFLTYKQACYFVHARFKYRVYFCGFGYVILCFRFTILSAQHLLTAPFLGGVSNALGIFDYAGFFFYGIWLFFMLLLLSYLSAVVTYFLISFVATLGLLGCIYLELPLPSTK